MLKVRPLTKGDLHDHKSYPIGNTPSMNDDKYDILLSDAIYKDNVVSSSKVAIRESNKEYIRYAHIETYISIPNKFLLGNTYGTLKKLFKYTPGLIPEDAVRMATGSTIVKKLKKNPTNFKDIEILRPGVIDKTARYDNVEHSYYIGGDAIKLVLLLFKDVVDIAIKNLLLATIKKELPREYKDKNTYIGDVISGQTKGYGIVDDFFFIPADATIDNLVRDKITEIQRILFIKNNIKGDFLPDITVLLAFRRNPENVINMCQNFVYVIPRGFRPSDEQGVHPLTKLYAEFYETTQHMMHTLMNQASTLSDVQMAYQEMNRSYSDLIIECTSHKRDLQYSAILESVKGKEGIFRNNVQAAFIDYSGRSVITVDPNMPVDTVGIPAEVAKDLGCLDTIDTFIEDGETSVIDAKNEQHYELFKARAIDVMEGTYILIGRQPTLYLLGMQAFKVKIVDGNSIVLNPLVTPAFNADFDGDQMHMSYPISPGAKKDVSTIMANVNNIFLPKDGSCTIYPRHEIIYGLYVAYNIQPNGPTVSYASREDFLSNVFNDLKLINIYLDNPCNVGGTSYRTVGYAILKNTLGIDDISNNIRLGVVPITTDTSKPEKCVNEDFYKALFTKIRIDNGVNVFKVVVDYIIKAGFTVANLYAPDIDLLKDIDTSKVKQEFLHSLNERQRLYNLGFETDESYSLYYTKELNSLEKKVDNIILETLGKENGYIQLKDSGARGSMSNIRQIFGMKGSIQKSRSEVFNTSINKSLVDGMTSLEHFITAYGSRDGIIDKVIRTHQPGYLSRLMSHTARNLYVKRDDCHTHNGIKLTFSFLKKMFGSANLKGDPDYDYAQIKDYFVSIVQGRFLVGHDEMLKNINTIQQIFHDEVASLDNSTITEKEGVLLRSPITCSDPCCVKCYGEDVMTKHLVAKGTYIGYLAAQSIGEPVTQLIMKNFQKGGVAGKKNITNSFTDINNLLLMTPLSSEKSSEPIVHDYISPVEGRVFITPHGNQVGFLNILNEAGKNVLREKVMVPLNVKYKKYVKRGDSIQEVEGILDPNEVLAIRGFDEAKYFILFQAYNIFRMNSVNVNFKHFECLVNGMIMYLCTVSNDDFKAGKYYTREEYLSGVTLGATFIPTLRGIKNLQEVKNDSLTALFLEQVAKVAQRNILVSGEDSLTNPSVRIALGLQLPGGSTMDGYRDERSSVGYDAR